MLGSHMYMLYISSFRSEGILAFLLPCVLVRRCEFWNTSVWTCGGISVNCHVRLNNLLECILSRLSIPSHSPPDLLSVQPTHCPHKLPLPPANMQARASIHRSSLSKQYPRTTPFYAPRPFGASPARALLLRARAIELAASDFASLQRETLIAGGAALLAVVGAIGAYASQQNQMPEGAREATGAAQAAAGEEAAAVPRENAVLVFGATGKAGRLIVQEVGIRSCMWFALAHAVNISVLPVGGSHLTFSWLAAPFPSFTMVLASRGFD